MSVISVCGSCGLLDNCMLYLPAKKWLCDECWNEYEKVDSENEEHEPCDECGSKFHSTMHCDFDEFEA